MNHHNNNNNNIDSVVIMEPFKIVEIRCKALRNTFGLIDHYFLIIDDYEYHMGFYKLGRILPKNSTRNFHTIGFKYICTDCYNKIIINYNLNEDSRLISYYPLLNCETLCTGFSIQSLAFLAIPFCAILIIKSYFLYSIILLLTVLIIILLLSKYTYSRVYKKYCKHIKLDDGKIIGGKKRKI